MKNFLKILKYAITIIILCSLQVSLCNYLQIGNIKPNLVISFVISISIINGPVTGGIVGLICGLFMDSLCSGTDIINSITYMYLAVIFGILNINYLRNNIGVAIIFTFLGTIIIEASIHFIHFSIWGVSNFFIALINPILFIALYTTACSIPVYYLSLKLFDYRKKEA